MNVFLLKTVTQDEALNLSEAGVFSLTCQIGDDVFVLAKIWKVACISKAVPS